MRNLIFSSTSTLPLSRFAASFFASRSMATLVLTKSPLFEDLSKQNSAVHFRPELAMESSKVLAEKLKQYPSNSLDNLVVGANEIDEDCLQILSKKQKNAVIIRRGTSLDRINMEAAKSLGVMVEATPHVNSVYVAEYIKNLLYRNSAPQDLGIIGFGPISRYVAQSVIGFKIPLLAFSPSLCNLQSSDKIFRDFDLTKITSAKSIYDLINKSTNIVIAASSGGLPIINVEDLQPIAKQDLTKIICISDTSIFTDKALEFMADLANRNKLQIHFDNSPKSMLDLQTKMRQYGWKNEGIKFTSEAMSSSFCQRDMDTAVLAVIIKNAIKYHLPEILALVKNNRDIEINETGKTVNIVGAGISGMISALYFEAQGYQIKMFDKAPDPKDNPDKTLQGISRGGPDVRHFSVSETVTHAQINRIESWLFGKISKPNSSERMFQENFTAIGKNPALMAIMQESVAQINYQAIYNAEFGLKYLQQKYPQIFEKNIFGSGKILRVFFNENELEKAFKFQKSIHQEGEVRKLGKQDLESVSGYLADLSKAGKICGAVEVFGYGFRVISACEEIANFLQQKSKLEMKWGKEITKDHDEKGGLIITSGISPLSEKQKLINNVYGLFYGLPNKEDVREPIKFHAPDPIGVMNITPSQDGSTLFISGGFEYFGHSQASEKDLENLFLKLEKISAELFPKSYEHGQKTGEVSKKYCPRPMTSHGFFQFFSDDKQIILGGTNSGGTVLSPLLAQLGLLQTEFDKGLIKGEAQEKVGEFLGLMQIFLENLQEKTSAKTKIPSSQIETLSADLLTGDDCQREI